MEDHMENARNSTAHKSVTSGGAGSSSGSVTSEAGGAQGAAVRASGAEGLFFDWSVLLSYLRLLKEYYRLYAVTLVLCTLLAVISAVLARPVYTAVAIVGPPGPSPTGALVGTGGGIRSALTNSFLSAGGTGTHDSFQDFLQILPSSRLSQALIDHDGFLQIVYSGQWNADKHQWNPPGVLRTVSNAIKRARHFEVSEQPGVDDLNKFFAAQLSVVHASSGASAGLLAKQSPYMVVTFKYSSPEGAERLLRTVLAEADRLVREDDGRDIAARVAFLRNQLLQKDVSIDERAALTSILSGQEQVLAMIHADERYASALIVPPHASLEPTSPSGLGKIIGYTILWSIVVWIGLVILGAHFEPVGKFTRWARRQERSR